MLPALVSVFDFEVTLLAPMMTRSAWVCAAFRPAILSSHVQHGRFPSYETRSSGYQPHTEFHGSAPSLQNLTGKRSLTYRIAPFMVELFAAGRLNRSPRRSDLGVLCRQRTAPHASRVARTRLSPIKPGPHGRDFHPLCLPEFSQQRSELSLHRHGLNSHTTANEVFPHRPSSRLFNLQDNSGKLPQAQTACGGLDRTLGLLRPPNPSSIRGKREFDRDY